MNTIKEIIGGKFNEKEPLPESVFIDTILQRYGWTVDDFHRQFERHPEYFGELMVIMGEEGKQKRAASKKSERAHKQHEMDERRKRLGVI
tara:strand:+ start:420 stop:689 length:270 start_codon:yes stop_codon:yes gene_type:complete